MSSSQSRPLADISDAFADAIETVTGERRDPTVIASGDGRFGDYQCNAAMGLAKRRSAETGEKVNPRELAQELIGAVELGDLAETPTVAGPGFINVTLRPNWVAGELKRRAADPRLGLPAAGEPQTVVVEYSSPNIAKQLHVGHLRSTILGDCIARVLDTLGHKVIRQNHVGDWGTQFGMLIAHMNHLGESADSDIKDLDGFYKAAKQRFDDDPAFQDEARDTVVKLQSGGDAERAAWKALIDATRAHYLPLYGRLGVQLREADERGESFYNLRLSPLTDELLAAGVLEESEGAVVSTHGGFKTPLIVRKTGGGFGYGTTDLAAAEFRAKELKADRVIYLVDQRQGQHFKQVFATVAAAADKASWPTADVSYEHAAFGMVLGEDGRPFKARGGKSVKLADLLQEAVVRAEAVVREKNPSIPDDQVGGIAEAVGIGAVKYADLSRDRSTDYVFDYDQMLQPVGNTGPYLQYAHARICSIFRKAGDHDLDGVTPATDAPEELALAKHLLRFGEAVETVARELRPHHLCTYLYELASRVNSFYQACPVLKSDEPVRSQRLALCRVTGDTLARGLELLGIEHPDQM